MNTEGACESLLTLPLLSNLSLTLFRRVGSQCLAKFGSAFGGDAMVSHCAAVVANKDIHELLTVDDTVRLSLFLLPRTAH